MTHWNHLFINFVFYSSEQNIEDELARIAWDWLLTLLWLMGRLWPYHANVLWTFPLWFPMFSFLHLFLLVFLRWELFYDHFNWSKLDHHFLVMGSTLFWGFRNHEERHFLVFSKLLIAVINWEFFGVKF